LQENEDFYIHERGAQLKHPLRSSFSHPSQHTLSDGNQTDGHGPSRAKMCKPQRCQPCSGGDGLPPQTERVGGGAGAVGTQGLAVCRGHLQDCAISLTPCGCNTLIWCSMITTLSWTSRATIVLFIIGCASKKFLFYYSVLRYGAAPFIVSNDSIACKSVLNHQPFGHIYCSWNLSTGVPC